MQLLFHGPMLGALAAPMMPRFQEFLQRPEIQRLAVVVAGLFVLGQVVAIFAHWQASRAVADKEDATLKNGFKLWAFHLGFAFAWGVGFAFIFSMVTTGDQWRLALSCGGAVLLGIVVVFLIPMKIYRIGFWSAFGLLLLSGVIQTVATTAMQLAAGPILFSEEQRAALKEIGSGTPDEQRRFVERLFGRDAPDEIDRLLDEALHPIGARKSRPEREAAVLAIQRKLEARRRTLSPADAPAIAHFQDQLGRYKRLLGQVNAERSAPEGR